MSGTQITRPMLACAALRLSVSSCQLRPPIDLHSWDEPTLQAVCHVGRHGLLQEYLRRQAELRSDLNVKLPRAMLKIRQATLLLWGER
jgi:hypothetical protein